VATSNLLLQPDHKYKTSLVFPTFPISIYLLHPPPPLFFF
jgi:hypothetical protein